MTMKKHIYKILLISLLLTLTNTYAAQETAPRVNGYLLNWCSHIGCGEATANIYCARTNQGKADIFEKGTGAKAVGGTWDYTSTGGYYDSNGDEYFNYISCNFTGQLYIGGTNTPLIVYSNGYPLDYCSFASCGQSTAEIYCQRNYNHGLLSYEEGSGSIAGSPGTWKYTLENGYHDTSSTKFFKSIVCGNEPKTAPGIACYNDSECGEGIWLTTYGTYWGPRCLNGKIYQPYQYYRCDNAGTYQSSCSSGVNVWQIKEECAYGCSTQTNTCNNPPEICDGIDNDLDGQIDENNPCNDGVYCNGLEACQNGACIAGTPIVCSDGIACTVDVCDEYSDTCGKPIPYDSRCDDGLYCNGKETCDKSLGCKTGIPSCNDNVKCTDNLCNENTDSCSYVENNTYCNDGLYCNGKEACNKFLDCLPGTSPIGNIPCVAYTCDEVNDIVWKEPNDNYCNDGLYCNGYEWCSASYGCQSDTPKNCNDGISCTADSCNENTDSCNNIPKDNDSDTYNCLNDCNDNDNSLWQLLIGYRDNDLDSYGTNPLMQVCSGVILPLGYVINNLDCDDSDANSYPGAQEILDGKDNDCDSLIDEYLCGNNVLEIGEQCDDGNLINGDGCSSLCKSESLANDFDNISMQDNGDGTYTYTFSNSNVPYIQINSNNALIDLTDTTFGYTEAGNIIFVNITNLILTGTTKSVTILYKKDICVLDKPILIGGTPTGASDCFNDPGRIVWRNSLGNKCNQVAPVIGKDSNGLDVAKYTCKSVRYNNKDYSEISGLDYTFIFAVDDSDNDGFSSLDDCNDDDPEINPNAIELPGNNIDENCDNIKLCDSPLEWKNHGNFVSCVSKEAEKLLQQGLITEQEKDELINSAAKTKIGKKN